MKNHLWVMRPSRRRSGVAGALFPSSLPLPRPSSRAQASPVQRAPGVFVSRLVLAFHNDQPASALLYQERLERDESGFFDTVRIGFRVSEDAALEGRRLVVLTAGEAKLDAGASALDAGSLHTLGPLDELHGDSDRALARDENRILMVCRYDLSEPLRGLGVTDIDFDDSFGLAAQIGADIEMNDKWVLNIDAKYIDLATDAEIQTAAGVLDTIKVDIDPWVFGVGFGWGF